MDSESVEAALEALEGEGGGRFDGPACDCVRALVVHAEREGGAVGERLLVRARAHLDALAARMRRQRTRVARGLAAFEAETGQAHPALHARLAQGDIVAVARTLRRLQVGALRSPVAKAGEVAAETVPVEPSADVRARHVQARAYEDSVAELVASFALARASDSVPDDAGPYNPLRIARETLDRMRAISPFYLTVQLNRLEELSSLLALPELPQKVSASQPSGQRKKRARPTK